MSFPLILTDATSAQNRPTLRRLRRLLADQVGMYAEIIISGVATGPEAARVVISADLRDDEIGYEFMGAPWVYAQSGLRAGEQRRILGDPDVGYQGPKGAVMVSRPFSGALAEGDVIEITNPLPVKRHLAIKGLDDCINEALSLILVDVRISLTGAGGNEYAMSSYPWLDRDEQIIGLYDSLGLPSGVAAERASGGARLSVNGATHTLVTDRTYGSGEPFQVAAVTPADRLIHDGVSWTYPSTPGLVDDTDRTAAPERWVLAFAMVKALQQLDKLVQMRSGVDPAERRRAVDEISRRRRQWATAALRIKETEFSHPQAWPTAPLVGAAVDEVWE